LIDFSGSTLFPGYSKTGISSFVLKPARFGEIGTCLWLLIVGVRKSNRPAAALREAPDESQQTT
jgi:hypothetical protein